MAKQSYYLIDTKYRRENRKKITLEFTDYEIDLIIKCLAVGYNNIDTTLFIFNDKEKDKDSIYYLQRILGCKANECFHNIKNNNFFRINLN